ncbi:MAG: glycosyltransferase family 4 protein [Myxococcaceae bacterium]|nr:glycosyltransferase family 4 protein [Myxococcaceae bacterium]
MPRLTILTQYFPPEMGAPQARLSEMGERLVDFGWSVDVLTALPNYPEGKVRRGYAPWKPVVEQLGRMRVARVPLVPSQKGFASRLGCYFSFAGSASALGPSLLERPDLLYVESPPLFIGYAARALSLRWRCPYVFNVSDLWPESAIRMGVVKPGPATALAEQLELSLYRNAAGVTGQSSEIIESVRQRAPGTPTELVTNGVDPKRWGPERATPEARALLGSEPGPVFVFAGLLGLAQGLDAILELAKSLGDAEPGRFVLIGDGPVREKLSARIAAERIGRVKLVPAQPREAIPALLACADAAVISLGMSIVGAVPSKIYEAMAASLPILLIADGEPAARVADAGCGLSSAPGDAARLGQNFRRIAGDPGLRRELGAKGRVAAETKYDRTAIATRLDAFLRGRLRG